MPELVQYFSSVGNIKCDRETKKPRVWLYHDKTTGQPTGECTITYCDSAAQQSALQTYDQQMYQGHPITVTPSIVKPHMSKLPPKPAGGMRGGRGRGGGGFRGGRGGDRGGGGMALVHLLVVGLQRALLGRGVAVRDGTLPSRLSCSFVVVKPDAGLLRLPVTLDVAHGAEVLDQLRHLGPQRQALYEDLDLGGHAGLVGSAATESAATTAPASTAAATASKASVAHIYSL